MSAPDLTRGVRASDAERERIAQLLQGAAAEGRLSPDEAGERLAAASAAVYREDLERLIGDLPLTPELPAGPSGRRPLPAWWLWRFARLAFVATLVLGFWGFWGIRVMLWPLAFVAFAILVRPWRRRRWRMMGWRMGRAGRGAY